MIYMSTIDKRTTLAKNIKKVRQSLHLTMEQFGKKLGTGKSSVSMWESGAVRPSARRLLDIAIMGNMTVLELLDPTISDLDIQINAKFEKVITFPSILNDYTQSEAFYSGGILSLNYDDEPRTAPFSCILLDCGDLEIYLSQAKDLLELSVPLTGAIGGGNDLKTEWEKILLPKINEQLPNGIPKVESISISMHYDIVQDLNIYYQETYDNSPFIKDLNKIARKYGFSIHNHNAFAHYYEWLKKELERVEYFYNISPSNDKKAR